MMQETRSSEFFPVFHNGAGIALPSVPGVAVGTAAIASLDDTLDVLVAGDVLPAGWVNMQGYRGFRAMFISSGGADNSTWSCDIELIERLQYPPQIAPAGHGLVAPTLIIRKYATLALTNSTKVGAASGQATASDRFVDTIVPTLSAYGTYVDSITGQSLKFYQPTNSFGECALLDIGNHVAMRFRPHTYGGTVALANVLLCLDT